MHVSAAGRRMIEEFEGCRLTAYRDQVGVLTIGFGCTGEGVYPGMTISQAEADEMFSDRLENEFEPSVLRALDGAPTTQAQFDAMVSLVFNIGTGGFSGSTVTRRHCEGDYEAAADAFLLWNKAGGRVNAGLVRRRTAERELYLSDDAEDDAPAPTPSVMPRSSPADSRIAGLWRRLFG